MKKTYLIFGKLIITLIILLTLNLFIFLGSSIGSADDIDESNINTAIKYENYELKKKYSEVQKRLDSVEMVINKMEFYDKYLYLQSLGVDVDSLEIVRVTRNMEFYCQNFDTIMKNVDDRSMLLLAITSENLNKFITTSDHLKKNKNIINNYPTISPVNISDIVLISSGFGWRKHPIIKKPIFHEGIDIVAKQNAKIYSTISGTVVKVQYSKHGYGNKVVIKNNSGYQVLYAHLSDNIYVKRGQSVKKGQIIGTMGNTGRSTGIHLHYEIRKYGELNDPLGYFYTYLSENNY